MEKTILVVDDDDGVREVLEEALKRKDYTVVSAESAERALDILKSESIMVMFLDLKLPGMDGMALCRKIRNDNELAVIHALTGHTDLFSLLDCRRAGFDDFYTKPIELEVLYEAAEHAFKKIKRWNIGQYDLV